MPVTLGLHHINLNVADVARAEKFYREAFGLEVRFKLDDGTVFVGSAGSGAGNLYAGEGNGAPLAVVNGIASAAASETIPRTPANASRNGHCHGGEGSRRLIAS